MLFFFFQLSSEKRRSFLIRRIGRQNFLILQREILKKEEKRIIRCTDHFRRF